MPSRSSEPLDIDTPAGLAQAVVERPADPPAGLLVLGHGAGGGVDTADLREVTGVALRLGYVVARVLQPYRVLGYRSPARAPALDAAWTQVVHVLRRRRRQLPLVVGGRSSGARVACRTAAAVGASGVLTLAFPVHPPGKPDSSRLPELDAVEVPVLALSGGSDPFGVPPERAGRRVVLLPGRGHGLAGPGAPIVAEVEVWLSALRGMPL